MQDDLIREVGKLVELALKAQNDQQRAEARQRAAQLEQRLAAAMQRNFESVLDMARSMGGG